MQKSNPIVNLLRHNEKYTLYFVLLVWFLVNLLQAAFTELAHDEAYYWMYSRHLDWGYFDHPPMVAILIKLGTLLFPGTELGVRIVFIAIGTGTIFNIYKLSEVTSIRNYCLIFSSIIIVHAHFAGFFALPDMPLIFFATLFLRYFKKYLAHDTALTTLAMAVSTAFMFYSKYHGVLLIAFMLFSNLQLFKRKSLYLYFLLVAIAMLPHLFWQINNGWPTFAYHLVGRSSETYKLGYTLNYLVSQPLIAGPITGFILFYLAFRFKPTGRFEKSLKVLFIGFYVFFFLMSFKGRVEAHWLATAIIPLIILSYKELLISPAIKPLFNKLAYITLGLFIFIRILLVTNFIPDYFNYRSELHYWDKWAAQIDSVADGKPVVFIDKFQYPSKYTFYTGHFATTLNSIFYRKNQYDLWNFEDSIQGKTVLLTRTSEPTDSFYTSIGKEIKYSVIENFTSYFNSVSIKASLLSPPVIATDSIRIGIKLTNNMDKDLYFNQPKMDSTQLVYTVFQDGKTFHKTTPISTFYLQQIPQNGNVQQQLILPPEKVTGKYTYVFSLQTGQLPPADNGGWIKIQVE